MYRSRGGEGEGAARCSSDVLLTNNSSEPVHVPALLDPRLGSERRAVGAVTPVYTTILKEALGETRSD